MGGRGLRWRSDAAWAALVLLSLGLFVRGFFLGRASLAGLKTPPLGGGAVAALPVSRSDEQPDSGAGRAGGGAVAAKGVADAAAAKKRVLILLVDAWRYDFAAWNNTEYTGAGVCQPKPPAPEFEAAGRYCHHINQMPLLHSLLVNQPDHARLFKFVADGPTATTQRVKALMTGATPVFFELSTTFFSGEAAEDSVPAQLHAAGAPIITFGDDVWKMLFGNSLSPRSRALDSFDIHDLDSVDNCVFESFIPAMRDLEDEYRLLVGHFLGVDHVGHVHNVNHPRMGDKLRALDEFIARVVRLMHEDPRFHNSVLYVFGDHGQNADGSHGGTTPPETDAALLAYSPSRPFPPEAAAAVSERRERGALSLRQANFAATLAVYLNLPIPFANVGRPLFEILPATTRGEVTEHWRRIVHQLGTLVGAYQERTRETWTGVNELLSATLATVDNGETPHEAVISAAEGFHEKLFAHFEREWTTAVRQPVVFAAIALAAAACVLTWRLHAPSSPQVADVAVSRNTDNGKAESTIIFAIAIAYMLEPFSAMMGERPSSFLRFFAVCTSCMLWSRVSALAPLLFAASVRLGALVDPKEAIPGDDPTPIVFFNNVHVLWLAQVACLMLFRPSRWVTAMGLLELGVSAGLGTVFPPEREFLLRRTQKVHLAIFAASLLMQVKPNAEGKTSRNRWEDVAFSVTKFALYLWGPAAAAAGLLAVIRLFALRSAAGEKQDPSEGAPAAIAALAVLTGYTIFLDTGHRFLFMTLPIEAGFFGTGRFIPLLSIATTAAHVLLPLVLPPLALRAAGCDPCGSRWWRPVLIARLAAMELSLLLLREHLSLWTVFAPKFCYEACMHLLWFGLALLPAA